MNESMDGADVAQRNAPPHSLFFEMLVGNPLCSDIQLRTSDGVSIPAHKAILCAVSMTFRTMFASPQYTESHSSEIPVPYESEPFHVALRYMYCGLIDDFAEPLAILDLSTYYCLDILKEAAVDVLKQQSTADNTFSMLDTALQFGCPSLRDHCITMIRQHNTEVIHSPQWLKLPLEVVRLLVHETVIEGEMCILRRCVEWCRANGSDGEMNRRALVQLLEFIDFTKMTEEEVEEVEEMRCIPLEVLYRAFKSHCLSLPAVYTPRKGGIILQWEFGCAAGDIQFNDSHVVKVSSDYLPRTVYAINRFSKGRHYFTFSIEDFRSPHDCLVGVSFRSGQKDYHFEPCCNTVCTPPGTRVVATTVAGSPLLQDHRCVVGVLLDFNQNMIQWYNHSTKQLLFTVHPPSDDPDQQGVLEHPLVPSVTLYHKTNGGVVLSESTSYLDDRSEVAMPCGDTSTPKGNKKVSFSPSPLKMSAARRTPRERR